MTARHKQRLAFVTLLLMAFGVTTALVLYSLEENLLYFYTPSQITDEVIAVDRPVNIGGLVVVDSVRHNDMTVRFEITDTANKVAVVYTGLLPDLFREGQGIVATGRINPDGVFVAETVLAKHDENYMPPAVAEALQQVNNTQPIGVKQPR